ncbi:hypothetical protein H6P81_012836 [Aristolochia fimbriata]|uniref:GTD-binding domain-containing protein n=1 Tax=Aristolochia fimbriata TaxID=158543 RepID=A0AAV7ED04_ARIFI|nr:hypothetical protein H6P81_012836 [Aristolochia fimbriata]
MPCDEIHAWTVSTLVGAFVDLALAYVLLCGAAVAFVASKFLDLFGLRLPCPCNGLFGGHAGDDACLQRALVDGPTRRISSVQKGVVTKFPFDSFWASGGRGDLKLLGDGGVDAGGDGRQYDQAEELDQEVSSSSASYARMSHRLSWTASPADFPNGSAVKFRFGVKGRGGVGRGPPSSLRRRRRLAIAHGRFSPISSSDFAIFGEKGKEMCGESSVSVDSGDAESYTGSGVLEETRHLTDNECYGQMKENFGVEASLFEAERLHHAHSLGYHFDKHESNTVRILEHALEEEQCARASLCLELEKERSAAATAADEAMGMIRRLQEEKASIEMEARQYQREIEEKSLYDEEEMNILKEILLRREKEKLALEKEVEMYHQMIQFDEKKEEASMILPDEGKNDLGYALEESGKQAYSSLDAMDDPFFMLQQINESIEKNGTVKDLNLPLETRESYEKQSEGHASQLLDREGPGIEIVDKHHTHSLDDCSLKFQQKGTVSSAESWELHSEQIALSGKMNDKGRTVHVELESQDKVPELRSSTSEANQLEAESGILDVHVIDDDTKPCGVKSGEKDGLLHGSSSSNSFSNHGPSLEAYGAEESGFMRDTLTSNMVKPEANIYRSRSDVLAQDNSQTKALVSALRRNSLSAVDYERLKLQTEVGRLIERLMVVQKGREKLAVSIENKERQRFHELQLLEEIASQLQEIRSLYHPVSAARRVSLPPLSKVGSKKRRCRSVSIHGSTD